ncbi:MAG TPA: DUF3108 domain-containing protein [Gemmatimonadaceae bacterium]
MTSAGARRMRRTLTGALGAAWLVALAGASLQAQSADLPFAIGERLEYRVRVAGLGTIGRGTMWIEGPAEVRGHDAWVLRFDMKAGRGPFKAEDRTTSWIDPERMASLRYTKTERHPLSRSSESVEMFPETGRWAEAGGDEGTSTSDAPLDELSFMYFLRTIPIDADTTLRFDRHFDTARNPTLVRVVGRERVTTEAGEYATVVLEMRVRDPRRYRGEGVIRIHLSDDDARVPVRIESRMPVVGTAVMSLSGRSPSAVDLAETRPAAPALP